MKILYVFCVKNLDLINLCELFVGILRVLTILYNLRDEFCANNAFYLTVDSCWAILCLYKT